MGRLGGSLAASILALGLLCSCRHAHTAHDDHVWTRCAAPPSGRCTGTAAGLDISGPLDPASDFDELEGRPGTAELSLSCAGGLLRTRGMVSADGTDVRGWIVRTDAGPLAVTGGEVKPTPELAEGRIGGVASLVLQDGSQVTISYEVEDERRCRPFAPVEEEAGADEASDSALGDFCIALGCGICSSAADHAGHSGKKSPEGGAKHPASPAPPKEPSQHTHHHD